MLEIFFTHDCYSMQAKFVHPLLIYSFCFFASIQAKVYDCFLFFNELDILDIRLHEMSPHVDYFVLVESTETFRGNPKPLYFQNNLYRYRNYLDKIIHVVIDEHKETNTPWERECWQRDQITRGLNLCCDDDTIIISDVDEILRRGSITGFVFLLKEGRVPILGAKQAHYSMYLNRFKQFWIGSMGVQYKTLRTLSPQLIRNMRGTSPHLPNMGWHFSSIGGPQNYIKKVEAFSLVERDTEEEKNITRIKKEMRNGTFHQIDEKFPFLVQKKERTYRKRKLIY